MTGTFITAEEARIKSIPSSIITNEIRAIEDAILAAITANTLTAVVNTNTTMTTDVTYYQAFMNQVIDRTKKPQIEIVKKYFTDLGYTVTILLNTTTQNTLSWNISW